MVKKSILADIRLTEWIKILSALIIVLKIFHRHRKEFDQVEEEFKKDVEDVGGDYDSDK